MSISTKKLAASAHAAVEELAASNPELLVNLVGLLESLMMADTAVSVPAKKGTGKAKSVDLDDDDDDAIPAKPAKGRAGKTKVVAADDDDEDEAEEGDEDSEGEGEEDEAEAAVVDFDDIDDADAIKKTFAKLPKDTPIHERVEGVGIREVAATIDEFGFDVAEVYKKSKATDAASKKAAAILWLSKIYHTVDAINAFELDVIKEKVEEFGEVENYKPKGRKTEEKEWNAAVDCFKFAVFGPDE